MPCCLSWMAWTALSQVSAHNFIDRVGKRYNRWLVLRRGPNSNHGSTQWLCRCDCGVERLVVSCNLTNETSRSCGCYDREQKFKHGKSQTTEFKIWNGAKFRASHSGLPFNISLEDVVIPVLCPLLSIPLVKGIKEARPDSPSLDRIRPDLGYVKGNVQVISRKANLSKSNLSFEEFERLYLNWKAKLIFE